MEFEKLKDRDSFLSSIQPLLESLEEVRNKKLANYEWRKKLAVPLGGIGTPIFGAIDWFLLRLQSGNDEAFAGLTVVALGALYMWVTYPKHAYAKTYKAQMMPKIAALIGNLTFNVSGRISMAMMQLSKIVPHHDRYNSEDHFSGAYKGSKIELAEVNLKQKRKTGKTTTYVTIFRGLAIYVELPKTKFYGHTILKGDQSGIFDWLGDWGSKLKRANLVDPEFEKLFDVYTTDQVEARYILDPVMMETVKELSAQYKGKDIRTAYYDGTKFLALIETPYNHFEPADIFTPAIKIEAVDRLRNELLQVLNIVDQLKLYDPVKAHAEERP